MNKLARDEKGYALILVLILLLLGSLLILPLLGYMTTGLKTGLVYEKKTNELYDSDAGIQEGLWRIKYNQWGEELQDREYDIYDFNTTWSYLTEPLNGKAANVSIQNVWIPSNAKLSDPGINLSAAQAKAMINSDRLVVRGTSGTSPGQYHITISFNPAIDIDPKNPGSDNLTVESIGVWLPQGFTYVDCSCTLDQQQHIGQPYYAFPPTKTLEGGGQAVVWSYKPYPPFSSFPGASANLTAEIAFNYTPPPGHPNDMPSAIVWITTGTCWDSNHLTEYNDVPISWDTDTRYYRITSSAGNTLVEAYSSKSELRTMGDAASGDYVATGNSLMTGNVDKRDHWEPSSDAAVSSIPPDGDVLNAYLYWSGFRHNINVFSDTCTTNFSSAWQNDGDWSYNDTGSRFYQAQHSGADSRRYLTMINGLKLSSYGQGAIQVSWTQTTFGNLSSGDGLDFAYSINNGSYWSQNYPAFRGGNSSSSFSYTIPIQDLTDVTFKLRFYLVGMAGMQQNVNIDNIKVACLPPDTSITFKINNQQVYLDADGSPQADDSGNLTASSSAILLVDTTLTSSPGFSYACHRDVSKLVKKYPVVPGEQHHTGNTIYTVGDVQADTGEFVSYAGWSLIIVYKSLATTGHYLYLRDVFSFNSGKSENLDFDGDGYPGGDITNFVIPEPIKNKDGIITESVAAKLTFFVGEGDEWRIGDYVQLTGQQSQKSKYLSNSNTLPNNVWNGKSYPVTSKDGVDIDTFEVLWSDKSIDGKPILTPNDSKLHLDMYSGDYGYGINGDSFNLIYIIVSIRSETTTSGTKYYVIGGG